jgi:hypothetical protein
VLLPGRFFLGHTDQTKAMNSWRPAPYTPPPRITWRPSADVLDGLRNAVLISLAVLVLVVPTGRFSRTPHRTAAVLATAAAPLPPQADFKGEVATADARQVADWVAASGDNRQLDFVILDKRDARVFVFDRQARLIGATPVLLGAAKGDDSVTGIGHRPVAEVRPEERTTPAGRFDAEPGRNTLGENVLWVDYDAAVSMHRVRVVDVRERRLQRLASANPADRRISYGCINVPVRFFEDTLARTFKGRRGVVYVLPEVKPLRAVFPALPVPAIPSIPAIPAI